MLYLRPRFKVSLGQDPPAVLNEEPEARHVAVFMARGRGVPAEPGGIGVLEGGIEGIVGTEIVHSRRPPHVRDRAVDVVDVESHLQAVLVEEDVEVVVDLEPLFRPGHGVAPVFAEAPGRPVDLVVVGAAGHIVALRFHPPVGILGPQLVHGVIGRIEGPVPLELVVILDAVVGEVSGVVSADSLIEAPRVIPGEAERQHVFLVELIVQLEEELIVDVLDIDRFLGEREAR